ncbi:MAG: hypothetical protein WBC21_00815 [Minisyncoccales bacterium]
MDWKTADTSQLILQVTAELKELSMRKNIKESISFLKEQDLILDVNPETSCSRVSLLCGKYALI